MSVATYKIQGSEKFVLQLTSVASIDVIGNHHLDSKEHVQEYTDMRMTKFMRVSNTRAWIQVHTTQQKYNKPSYPYTCPTRNIRDNFLCPTWCDFIIEVYVLHRQIWFELSTLWGFYERWFVLEIICFHGHRLVSRRSSLRLRGAPSHI